MSVINLYKPMGWSPLQAMLKYKDQNSNLKDSIMVYAGRLDPMAEGVMIILSDEDRFKKDEYLSLNKTYEVTILFGFESDSFDALGLVKKTNTSPLFKGGKRGVCKKIKDLKQTHNLPFPNYSSYKVQCKPLHWWTKHGRLDEIEIPLKEMKVLSVDNVELNTIDSNEVLAYIISRIEKVEGDFRQESIISNWKEILVEEQKLIVATFRIEVSSGTYVRSLANKLGKDLDSSALLLNLKRTRVGEFDILDSEKL